MVLKLASFGIDSCQLCTWAPQYWTDENAQKVKELIAAYGMTVSAFWCGWDGPRTWNFYEGQKVLGLVPPEYRAMRMKNLCDGANFAHQLGLVNVITHMGFIPENPYDPEFEPLCDAIRTVAEHLKQNGQWLLFESGQETPVTLLRCFETVGCDNLGVNLDTANLILYGKAQSRGRAGHHRRLYPRCTCQGRLLSRQRARAGPGNEHRRGQGGLPGVLQETEGAELQRLCDHRAGASG